MNPNHSMQGPQDQRRVREDAIVLQFDRPLAGRGKPRLRWTKELHDRFLWAVFQLGDLFSVKPIAVLETMNVEGLTLDQIKSHLQRCRDNTKRAKSQGDQKSLSSHSPQLSVQGSSGQGSSASRSTAPVNGKGLETSQPKIEGHGNFPQNSEAPNYYPGMRDNQDDPDLLIPNYFLKRLGN